LQERDDRLKQQLVLGKVSSSSSNNSAAQHAEAFAPQLLLDSSSYVELTAAVLIRVAALEHSAACFCPACSQPHTIRQAPELRWDCKHSARWHAAPHVVLHSMSVSASKRQHRCCCCCWQVVEVQDLEHLESLLDKAGSSLVVVAFYTRSCGVCKELLKEFQAMCDEAKAAQVRLGCVHLVHCVACVLVPWGVQGAAATIAGNV
jgi:hypothetical protein